MALILGLSARKDFKIARALLLLSSFRALVPRPSPLRARPGTPPPPKGPPLEVVVGLVVRAVAGLLWVEARDWAAF